MIFSNSLPVVHLQGNGFVLRPLKKADAGSMAHHANNINVWNNLRDIFPHPYTKKDAESFIFFCKQHHPHRNLGIEVNNSIVGTIGLIPKDDVYIKNAEFGYWLGEEHWGKGIVSEAIPLFLNYAFNNFDLIRIYAECFESNIASQQVLIKAGFRKEGHFIKSIYKNRQMLNSYIFAICFDEFKQKNNSN